MDNIGLILFMDQNASQELTLNKKGVITMTFHMIMNETAEFHLRKVSE